jgi:hypothetical protein
MDARTDEAMQRLAELARGDRDATLYGLKVAEKSGRGSDQPDESKTPPTG